MEEYSTNSMSKLAPIIDHDDDINQSPEESSWTMYLEDFLVTDNNLSNSPISASAATVTAGGSYDESSLISDAGSLVNNIANHKKLAADCYNIHDNHEKLISGTTLNYKGCNRLSFKKRKAKEADLVDDALEDTASSPVNSPKVFNYLSQLDVKPKERDHDHHDMKYMSQEKGSTAGQIDERINNDHQLGFINGSESDSSVLKKRGLCLVPLSMVENYLG